MKLMDKKKYLLEEPGTGHSPHVLQNADDAKEKVYLCSCGGTANPHGFCDGTHKKKLSSACHCLYCQSREERLNSPTRKASS